MTIKYLDSKRFSGTSTGVVNGYSLSTASYDSVSFSVTSQETTPRDVTFKSDGTKMYVIGDNSNTVYQYSLSTAWDLSTTSYDSVSFSVSSQEGSSQGLTFKSDGTKMYVIGTFNDTVYQYSLSTAWDLSTSSYDSVSFSVGSQETVPRAVIFKSDGTKMYVVGTTNDTVYQYTLSTAWDMSTASYDSVSFSVGSQDTFPTGVVFKSDGTKMYISGDTNNTIYQYSLSTAWDLSTTSYDSVSFSVGSQETRPTGVTFGSDGTKMYTFGQINGTVYQYTTSSTASDKTALTNVQDNSIFVEKDTAKRYWFDGTDWTWENYYAFRGIFCGGGTSKIMDYISIATLGNATDFGDLLVDIDIMAGVSSETRGVIGGGSPPTNVMQYITISTLGNATDFGDLTVARNNLAGASNLTRGIFAGGDTGSDSNVIDYITISTLGNATDFGDLTRSNRAVTGLGNATRGVFAGGALTTNVMDYVTIASAGNATDFGDLTAARRSCASAASSTRGVFAGGSTGSNSNVIDYITIATTGNATDFGDLTVARQQLSGVTSDTRGCFGGGSAVNDTIDYITIATTGNATDFGNLTVGRTALSSSGLWG